MTIGPLDLADPPTLAALIALQRAAYAVEAELLRTTAIPALHETAEQLAASGETFLGARDEAGALVGAVSYKRAGGTVDVHRLVVDPSATRRGIASALLDALPAAAVTVVATGAANGPALALYEQRGFVRSGESVVAGGVRIVHLRRETRR